MYMLGTQRRVAHWITKNLETRFGKATTNISAGAVSLLFSVTLAGLYFRYAPAVDEAGLVRADVAVSGFSVDGIDVEIRSRECAYSTPVAGRKYWTNVLEKKREALNHALAGCPKVALWFDPQRHQIFGIDACGVSIAPGRGVRAYMSDRLGWLCLWILFLVLGAMGVSYGLWQRRRVPRLPTSD